MLGIRMHRESKGERRSQRQRILDLLVRARGAEVTSRALAAVSLQYGARVRELRELGFQIVNRTETHGRMRHGFFKLVLGTPTPAHATVVESEAKQLRTSAPIGADVDAMGVCTESGRLFPESATVNADHAARFYPD